MTEKKKRFFESMYEIIDREKGRQLQMYEIIDLLNEQDEEIKELKKENEQLKQKLENLDLNEKNDTVKMIDGKVFIKM